MNCYTAFALQERNETLIVSFGFVFDLLVVSGILLLFGFVFIFTPGFEIVLEPVGLGVW